MKRTRQQAAASIARKQRAPLPAVQVAGGPAAMTERAALLANFVNTIGARIGAREQGYGAQSIEAGEARYRAGIMKRLDELLAAEAIARHLDDAATDEEARECVERLGIDVTTWAAEVRAKVLAALGDNLPTKET